MRIPAYLPAYLIAAAGLASCTAGPHSTAYDEANAAKLQRTLAGKTAGAAVSCLPSYRSNDLIRAGDDVAIFRDGPNRVYVNRLNGSCSGLGNSNYALVTKTIGSSSVCRGDIARIVDLATGMTVGSCSFGDFVPYSSARS
jgi:hypothetical protein